MIRERARWTKMESTHKRRKGVMTKETSHTISMKERNKRDIATFSKREVARAQNAETNHRDHSESAEPNAATTSKQPPKQTKGKQQKTDYQSNSTDLQIRNN